MEKLKISLDKRILVIAPHPDDETYGCGGILLTYKEQCDVVLLAYGETGNPNWTKDRTLRIRRKEFRDAMNIAKATIVAELGIVNRRVHENLNLISELDYSKYDYIFVPNRKDKHSDHRCVLKAVKRAKTLKKDAVLLQYEMWGALADATHYADISSVINEKEQLMLCYKSQEERVPYCARIRARDYYKALETYDKKSDYVELFYQEPPLLVRVKTGLKIFLEEQIKKAALLLR